LVDLDLTGESAEAHGDIVTCTQSSVGPRQHHTFRASWAYSIGTEGNVVRCAKNPVGPSQVERLRSNRENARSRQIVNRSKAHLVAVAGGIDALKSFQGLLPRDQLLLRRL